jgi:hypothetical protein
MIELGAMKRMSAQPDSSPSARRIKGFENLVLIVLKVKNQRPPNEPGMPFNEIPNRPARRPDVDDIGRH